MLALWFGWIVTEVGRQPWIVYGFMRTKDAASNANGLEWGLFLVIAVYSGLIVALVAVLRGLAGAQLPAEFTDEIDDELGGPGRPAAVESAVDEVPV